MNFIKSIIEKVRGKKLANYFILCNYATKLTEDLDDLKRFVNNEKNLVRTEEDINFLKENNIDTSDMKVEEIEFKGNGDKFSYQPIVNKNDEIIGIEAMFEKNTKANKKFYFKNYNLKTDDYLSGMYFDISHYVFGIMEVKE